MFGAGPWSGTNSYGGVIIDEASAPALPADVTSFNDGS